MDSRAVMYRTGEGQDIDAAPFRVARAITTKAALARVAGREQSIGTPIRITAHTSMLFRASATATARRTAFVLPLSALHTAESTVWAIPQC
jgi:hypothetical protein